MSDTMFCGECATQIPASAKFCHACGARQHPVAPPVGTTPPRKSLFGPPLGEPPAPPPPPAAPSALPPPTAEPPPPVAQRVERAAPGASELADELAHRLSAPGVVAATVVGAFALLTCLAVGLITAVLSPDRTIVGFLHSQDGIVTEALRQTVATTLASVRAFGDGGEDSQLLPLVFGATPFFGAAFGARVAAPSLAGMSTREATAWSAGGAVVFAAGMLILALIANGQDSELGFGLDFSIGSVLLMSLLLAGAGAAFGALRPERAAASERAPGIALPPAVSTALRIVATPLIGLAALLGVTTFVGFVHLEVQTIRGQEEAVTPLRSDLGAAIENILFVPDVGIDTAGLALFGEFDESVLPVDDDKQSRLQANLGDDGTGRIFDYGGALPIYVFLPELLILIGAALAAALYAGFATARRAAPPTQLVAAGWGALTGIVWALALALVLLRAFVIGQSTLGDSVFAGALLVGSLLGAAGGLLAVRPAAAPAPPGP
jgi:hypothetical protein